MSREIIRYLEEDFSEPIRDPIWKNIYITPSHIKIISTSQFRRLDRIKQLGGACFVYPGATHTRLSHSLGVLCLAKRIIKRLVTQSDCPPLSIEGVKSFLSAALLHDIGHFPHAHSLGGFPLKEHEELAVNLIKDSPIASFIEEEGGSASMTASIIDTSEACDKREISFFRAILSGVIDPDKLDYLNRDAYFCGVPYGVQDVDFIISQISPSDKGFTLPEKGVPAIEHLLFAKYLMYRNVYWHKTVIISNCMVRKALYQGLQEGIIEPEELYKSDDALFSLRYGDPDSSILSYIDKAERPWLYYAAVEEPVEEDLPLYKKLENFDFRFKVEREVAKVLKIDELLIDISPKPSFEVDLYVDVKGERRPFDKSGTLFTRSTIKGFTDSLRKMRVILPKSDKRVDAEKVKQVVVDVALGETE